MNIVITGISSSIGLELIKNFDKKNNLIWGQYYKSSPEAILREIKNTENFNLFSVDFCKYDELKNFSDTIFNSEKKIDVLIHLPSAKLEIRQFEKISWASFEHQILIQVRSLHVLISRLKKRIAQKNNAKIIVCGSEVTEGSIPAGMIDYVTTKGMLKYYCESLKKELQDKNVTIHYISPGMFRSKLLSNLPNYIIEKYCSDIEGDPIHKDILPLILSYIYRTN